MKKAIIALVAATFVSGCLTAAPQTAAEMRAAVNGGAFMSSKTSQTVPRSFSAVTASLRQGAQKCMNRNQEVRSRYSPGPGMAPVMHTMRFYYTTTVRTSGGRTELAMKKKYQGAKLIGGGEDNSGMAYVVDAVPTAGGTRLDFYGGKMGYGQLNDAVLQWAKGGSIRCPQLP